MIASRSIQSCRPQRRSGYVLLETVVATGMLIVGLAVIGAQVQGSEKTMHKMERRMRALMLAEQELAELDMGMVEMDSVDEVQEGDFGPRYPDFGWLLTTEDTSIENMYLRKLEVFHHLRDGQYRERDFDYDNAERIVTLYSMQTVPPPVDFAQDFGLTDDEVADLADQFDSLGIEGLSVDSFDPSLFQKIDYEQLLTVLPMVMGTMGMDTSQFTAMIPPTLLQQLKDSGVFGDNGLPGQEQEEGDQQQP